MVVRVNVGKHRKPFGGGIRSGEAVPTAIVVRKEALAGSGGGGRGARRPNAAPVVVRYLSHAVGVGDRIGDRGRWGVGVVRIRDGRWGVDVSESLPRRGKLDLDVFDDVGDVGLFASDGFMLGRRRGVGGMVVGLGLGGEDGVDEGGDEGECGERGGGIDAGEEFGVEAEELGDQLAVVAGAVDHAEKVHGTRKKIDFGAELALPVEDNLRSLEGNALVAGIGLEGAIGALLPALAESALKDGRLGEPFGDDLGALLGGSGGGKGQTDRKVIWAGGSGLRPVRAAALLATNGGVGN